VIGETDLALWLPLGIWDSALAKSLGDILIAGRASLLQYIRDHPDFAATHRPWPLTGPAPAIVRQMSRAAAVAAVGPMAAVAGAFAALAGRFLLQRCGQVIVENGGDIFLAGAKDRVIGVYAGAASPFTGNLGVKLRADQLPCGVCTSSGTVGPSFSYGVADAALIVAPDAALADAAATAAGNLVKGPEDVAAACHFALTIPGVTAALIICGEQLAAAGQLELVRVEQG